MLGLFDESAPGGQKGCKEGTNKVAKTGKWFMELKWNEEVYFNLGCHEGSGMKREREKKREGYHTGLK